jgi:hypothetical protein
MALPLSPDDIKLMKTLLLKFVDDIQKGSHVDDAGWVSSVNVGPNTAEFCDTGNRGIRVSAVLIGQKDLQCYLDDEGQDLWLICSDILKSAKLEHSLDEILSESVQAPLLAVGLECMLQSSEFPIAPERVLQQGIEPDQWQIQVSSSIPELTLNLTQRFWNVESWDKALQELKHWHLPVPEIKAVNANNFGKVSKVLEWDKAVGATTKDPTMALGLVWYADYLIGLNEIQAPEGAMIVQKKAWSIVQAILGKSGVAIKKEIQEMVDGIDMATRESDEEYHTRPVASWVDIIRLPW